MNLGLNFFVCCSFQIFGFLNKPTLHRVLDVRISILYQFLLVDALNRSVGLFMST